MIEVTRTRTALALLLAAALATAAPGAGARTADSPLRAGATAAPHPTAGAHPDGFDWGDAGLGAAGMLSLLGLGAGATLIARRDRGQRTVG